MAKEDNDGWQTLSGRLRDLKARIEDFERFHMSKGDRIEKARALRQRHCELDARIEAAIARGDLWQCVGREFDRDFEGLSEAVTESIGRTGDQPSDSP